MAYVSAAFQNLNGLPSPCTFWPLASHASASGNCCTLAEPSLPLPSGFERGEARFVSTRCKDGDTVSGRPLRAEPGGGVLPAGWYKW